MRSALPLLVCLLALAACHTAFAWPSKEMTGMAFVPAGWFSMGKDDARNSNRPEHWVYLDAFATDRTEVTRGSYRKFLERAGFVAQATVWTAQASGSDDLPEAGITWKNAAAYCRWAGKRLPREPEWEKASRGVDGRRYPWGDTWTADLANTVDSGQGTLVSVGRYLAAASSYGALDTTGNVAKRVADFYDAAYYTCAPSLDPPGPQKVMDHGLRGGSWDSSPEEATTFFRDSSHSARPNLRVGFRCALSLEPDGG